MVAGSRFARTPCLGSSLINTFCVFRQWKFVSLGIPKSRVGLGPSYTEVGFAAGISERISLPTGATTGPDGQFQH